MLTACPKCGAHYALADEALGRMGRCKACGRKFAVLPVGPTDAAGRRAPAAGRTRRVMALAAVALATAVLGAAVALLVTRGQLLRLLENGGF